jgi:hypothetical protein
MKNMKRIHKVVIKRMYDTDPDTSWLGEYGNSAESEYSIDRAHDLDCPQQTYNQKNSDRCMLVIANSDKLGRAIDYLTSIHATVGYATDNDDITEAQDILSEAQDSIAGEANDCTCGNESDNWNNRTYRFFNPSGNYKDETPENTRKYVRQDYERMEALNNNEWGFIGIRAEADVTLLGGTGVMQEVSSGGLWGIESDADAAYLESVEKEELSELRTQLHAIGFSTRAISAAFKSVEHPGDAR